MLLVVMQCITVKSFMASSGKHCGPDVLGATFGGGKTKGLGTGPRVDSTLLGAAQSLRCRGP